MAVIRVKPTNPITSAHASVSSAAIVAKPRAVAAPGERTVLTHKQTITSAGTTPAQHVAADDALSGSMNFGSVSGTIGSHWVMIAALALAGFVVARKWL